MLATLSLIKKYSQEKAKPVSLKMLYNYGKNSNNKRIINQTKYIYQEVPVRISKRIIDLQNLPYDFCKMKGMQKIHDDFVSTFDNLIKLKNPNNLEECLEYTKILEKEYNKHKNIEFELSNVIKSYKSINNGDIISYSNINYNLKKFYLARISLRLLVNQHIEVLNGKIADNNVGLISIFDPILVIKNAINEVKSLAEQHYLDVPEIKIVSDVKTEILYIPRHLHYIIFELLKNSLEATVNFNYNKPLPPIKIYLYNKDNQITIKIEDEGGGFNYNKIDDVFSFFYTKNINNDLKNSNSTNIFWNDNLVPISGFGHGLGLSKLYANYFGGNLSLIPIPGKGCNSYLHINSLGYDLESINETSADKIY